MNKQEFSKAFDSLSPQLKKVLQMLLNEKTDREIAQFLKIAETTVRKHIENINNHFEIESDKALADQRCNRRSKLIELCKKYNIGYSEFYIEREPNESKCFQEMLKLGSLIRIKAPQKMGKSYLLNKIFEYAKKQGYKTSIWNLLQPEENVIQNLDKLLRSLCTTVDRDLQLNCPPYQKWDENLGSNDNCTFYFEDNVLPSIDFPLVLALDNVDRIFPYQTIASDFLGLLRSWHEAAKGQDIWQKLRLVISYSTADYPKLNIDFSPFNVGMPVELPEFNYEQVEKLASQNSMDFTQEQINQLMNIVGGHPFLLQTSFNQIKNHPDMSLKKVLLAARTNMGLYANHLREINHNLQQDPELVTAMKKIVKANKPVAVDEKLGFKLDSMGLVKKQDNNFIPRCNLYKLYFQERL
ncbi:MAG: AAA-like domain-containing protein [Microcoleaceae cyanobacterium]